MNGHDHSARFTRREVIRLLGGAAGLGIVGCSSDQASSGPDRVASGFAGIPNNAIIRTVKGDVRPEAINGVTLFHEHLSIRMSPDAESATDDVDNVVREIRTAAAEGVGCLVDGGHPDLQRDLDAVLRVANETDVHIVASGGYYMDRYYPPEIATMSEDQIAESLVAEAARDRLGAYGEIGQNSDAAQMTANERKVFRAVGKAHIATGLPVFTHNAYGTGENVRPDAGLIQLDVLESVGVSPDHIVIGHACCLDDPSASVLIEIAERGAFVGFDRVTGGRVDDSQKVVTIIAFLEAGHADKLLISSDFTGRRSEQRPGYGNSITVFAPLLRAAGVDEGALRAIQRDNPRRFLAFVPA
jgi:phosphotriesterase-related protein